MNQKIDGPYEGVDEDGIKITYDALDENEVKNTIETIKNNYKTA